MSKLWVVVGLLSVVSSAHADEPPPAEPPPTPPLRGQRVAGEIVVGGLFSLVGGAVGIVTMLWMEEKCSSACNGLPPALALGASLSLATSAGVYLVGASTEETGSFAATLGGAVVGAGAGLGILAAADAIDHPAYAIPFLFAGPLAGAIVGFNLTREYDDPKPRTRVQPVVTATHDRTVLGVMGSF